MGHSKIIYPKVLYYECHVTTEPVVGERLIELEKLAALYTFRVANLVMLEKDTPNQRDAFCSARSLSLFILENLMMHFVETLKRNDFTVFRYKLEATLFDTKETNVTSAGT